MAPIVKPTVKQQSEGDLEVILFLWAWPHGYEGGLEPPCKRFRFKKHLQLPFFDLRNNKV